MYKIDISLNNINRLGLDYVDLYLMHSPAGGATVETWKTMIDLKKQGLAKLIITEI